MNARKRKMYRSAIAAGMKVVARLLALLPEIEQDDTGEEEEIRLCVSHINASLIELQLLTQED